MFFTLVLAACGNYSNDDLEFLEALPGRQDLQAQVPQDQASALALKAWLYSDTVAAAMQIDEGVEAIIDAIDLIRDRTPSGRTADARTWGPFADSDPRFEDQVVIARSAQTFNFAFSQRPVGQSEFVKVLSGTFVGASAAKGHGSLDYEVAPLEEIGHAPADPNLRSLRFVYANDAAPRTVHTTLLSRNPDNGQVATLSYVFTESAGEGNLDYDLQGQSDAGPYDVRVLSRWLPDGGAGRADGVGSLQEHPGWLLEVHQCWDARFLETYYDSQAGLAYPDGGFIFGSVPSVGCDALLGLSCPRGELRACPF